jgi:hypothetical protein
VNTFIEFVGCQLSTQLLSSSSHIDFVASFTCSNNNYPQAAEVYEQEQEDEEVISLNSNKKMTDTDIFNKLLEKGYDWRVRPPGTNLSINGK